MILISIAWSATVQVNPGDDITALTASLSAGSEVVFSAGTYTVTGPVYWTGIGSEASPIKLTGTGEVVIENTAGWAAAYVYDAQWMEITNITFRGAASITDDHDGMYVENVDHLTIRDCEFGPVFDDGISFGGNNTNVTFEKNHVHDATDGNGIYVGCYDAACWTQDSTFANNWIHDIGGDYHQGIHIAPGGQGNTLRDNVIYSVTSVGIDVNSTEFGDPNIVEGNAIWNVAGRGIGVFGAAQVRNNVVFNVDGNGIVSTDNGRDTLDNLVITHNTVYGTGDYAIEIEGWAGRAGMVLANNALSNTTGYGLAANPGGIDDTNYISNNVVTGLVTGLGVYTAATPYLPGGGETDYTDPVSWDYYPSSNSALLGAADPAAAAYVPPTDFNGAARNGDAPDAGAYERGGDGNPGWLIQEGFKDVGKLDADADGPVTGGCCATKSDGTETALLAPWILTLWWRRRSRAA